MLIVVVVRMNTGILTTPRFWRYALIDQFRWGDSSRRAEFSPRRWIYETTSFKSLISMSLCIKPVSVADKPRFSSEGDAAPPCHTTKRWAQWSAQRSLRHVHILTLPSSCCRQNLDSSSIIMLLHMFNCQSGTGKAAPGGTGGSKQESITTAK